MRREMKVGEVFHAQTTGINYTYLVYNRALAHSGDHFFYGVVCLFAYGPSRKHAFFNSSIFGYLYNRNRLDEFPHVIRELLSDGYISSLFKNGLDKDYLSFSSRYNGHTFPILPLHKYPEEIRPFAPYFMDPTNIPIYKNISPSLHLD